MYPSQNLTLMTDLYQLTMMQGYYTYHKTSQRVVFDLFYRENPSVEKILSICGPSVFFKKIFSPI